MDDRYGMIELHLENISESLEIIAKCMKSQENRLKEMHKHSKEVSKRILKGEDI